MSELATNLNYQIAYVMMNCLWEATTAIENKDLDTLVKATQAFKEMSEACSYLDTARVVKSESVKAELERIKLMISKMRADNEQSQ